ncbi:unnamed protein product [Prorocentrum cordatum]|uniref:Phospholipase B-like n=1 Tax=Prorocentrum cordatum TaxID=2364126 RepID=A0ABN9X5S0_9DINO|nr:unnamed protein product [Polarella glacialis]
MYAAGLVEGFLTAERLREFHRNSQALLLMSPDNRQRLPGLQRALARSVEELAAASRDAGFLQEAGASALETQAGLAFLQAWGVRDGYELARARLPQLSGAAPLSMVDLMLINSDGVVDELMAKYGGEGGADALLEERASRGAVLRHGFTGARHRGPAASPPARHQPPRAVGHCTALARLTEDRQELYLGHTTWEAYSEMTRIWKVYDFPLKGVAARKISFSSYPGCVSSTDDYYLMDSGLAVTETTLQVPGTQHYDTSASSLPDFLRIMAANRIASSGKEWVDSMVASATGTYSSQWLVTDYGRFSPGSSLPEGTFYVLEQAPGISHFEDMSAHLQKEGYWASYDRAYFDDVRDATGDAAMEAKLRAAPAGSEARADAALYSKSDTPRAQIVRQTARGVGSLEAMREEMTRNRGTEEPVREAALRVPWFTISARSDLEDKHHINRRGSPEGGVDSKVTSSCLFRTLTAEAISSPTHVDMPPFRWTSASGEDVWPGYPHEGLPTTANFDWVRVDAQDQMLSSLGSGSCN